MERLKETFFFNEDWEKKASEFASKQMRRDVRSVSSDGETIYAAYETFRGGQIYRRDKSPLIVKQWVGENPYPNIPMCDFVKHLGIEVQLIKQRLSELGLLD